MTRKNFTSEQLQKFIDSHHVEASIIPLNQHTSTVKEAAIALAVETDQIIKSLVFLAADEPILVINNGMARVDKKKLAARLSIGRKKIKFASAEQALEITGFVVGSMPPFGHKQKLRTFLDPAITKLEFIFGGGGDINAMMRMTPAELLRVTEAEVLKISG